MNGIVEITVKKKKHVLRFGMLGCFEFQNICANNPSGNHAKICNDLVYSGIYGDNMRNGLAAPDYKEVFDLFNEFSEQDDYSAQMDKVWECYQESKWGKKYLEGIAEYNKKKVEEEAKP